MDAALLARCVGGVAALQGSQAYPTVDDAIGAAPAGGVVLVCPGRWPTGARVTRDLALEVIDATPGTTVLDGAASGRVLDVSGGALEVDGLGFVGASDGAIQADIRSELAVACCRFVGNVGGAIVATAPR